MGNKITEILFHDISWYVESKSVKELDESSIEHITSMINDGCSQGELNISYGRHNQLETRGWWKIIDWKDIALEMSNATKDLVNATPFKTLTNAVKRFDDQWAEYLN